MLGKRMDDGRLTLQTWPALTGAGWRSHFLSAPSQAPDMHPLTGWESQHPRYGD